MAKQKSSAAYRAADALNKQLKAIYNEFDADSEIYQLYVNKLTATLPPGSTHISKSGVLQVSKAKGALTAAQIKSARKGLPSVQRAKTTYKRQLAEEKLRQQGIETPTDTQIQKEAAGVTQEELQRYVEAKSYVKSMEDSKGKLKYDESVTNLMKSAGAKSYELLMLILQEGERRANAEAQKEAANAATIEAGYENGRANTNNQRAKV